MDIWLLASGTGVIGILGCMAVLKLSGYDLMSDAVIWRASTALGIGLAAGCGVAFYGVPKGTPLAQTLGLMTLIAGPLSVCGLIVLLRSLRRGMWIRVQEGIPLPPGVDEKEVIDWALRKGWTT